MAVSILVKVAAARRQVSARQKACTDLWWLATEILGFDKLSAEFHKPMMDDADAMRSMRKFGRRRGGKDTLWIWPREHYKTTCRKAQVIQNFLCDPAATHTWWHWVQEKAEEVSIAVGTTLQKNRDLRKLMPDGVIPSINARRFVGARGFRLNSNRLDHGASFSALGQSAEATGGHCDYGLLDDVIARNTIEDSAMPKVRSWYRNTVRSVVLARGWLDASGTPWDEDDIYSDWQKSPHWKCTLRACSEDAEGRPDDKGRPVLMTLDQLALKRREMGEADYAAQMMCNPSPQGEKPWDSSKCEHVISAKEAMSGPGVTVALSDPAPATVGAYAEDKKRDDGEKDYWSHAVVRFRRRGQRREIILLDGAQSKTWGPEEGFRELCNLKRRFGTSRHAVEKTGQAVAFYEEIHRRIARDEGVRYHPVELTMTYRGKNLQFSRLCDRAKSEEFLVSDGCSKEFSEAFLDQARHWRPLKTGRNSLKYDDAANVVSFAADPVFERLVPEYQPDQFGPFNVKPVEEGFTEGSRYVRW